MSREILRRFTLIISNIKNPNEFFEEIKRCKGRVELLTKEGDRINLKSKLCQYIYLVELFKNPEIKEMELLFSNPEDVAKVFNFLVVG